MFSTIIKICVLYSVSYFTVFTSLDQLLRQYIVMWLFLFVCSFVCVFSVPHIRYTIDKLPLQGLRCIFFVWFCQLYSFFLYQICLCTEFASCVSQCNIWSL